MTRIMLIGLCLGLSGCNSLDLEPEVGSIDYCITFLDSKIFCVHAERSILDPDDAEE